VVVGLIRLHLEKVQPPRALWVPFELGRPLGGYIDGGAFQKQVLQAALTLLDRSDGPVILQDFTEDDPGAAVDTSWRGVSLADCTSLADELRLLKPQWLKAVARLGRSMADLSGMPIEQVADYLERFDSNNPAPNPNDRMSDLLRLRYCADDIKAFYTEAALASGSPSSKQIGDWFWDQSRAADVLQRIRRQNINHATEIRARVCGFMIVPGTRIVA